MADSKVQEVSQQVLDMLAEMNLEPSYVQVRLLSVL